MKKWLMIWVLSSFILSAQPLNINLKQMDINRLIEITSLVIGKSILTPHPIHTKVNFSSTKQLDSQDLLEILTHSLQANGYDLMKENNIYKVVKVTHQKTQLVELKNANAKEILNILQSLQKDSVQISLIEDLNSLLLMGSHEEVFQLEKMIQQLDVKRMQVYVKARIIEVNNEKVNHVGVQYGLFKSKSTHSELFTFSSSLNGVNSGKKLLLLDEALSFGSQSVLALGASINLLKQNHAIDIISEPSILCLNNQESSIYVGEKKSIRTASTVTDGGTTKESYVREDIGLTLKVTPRISSDNKVLLKIQTILENFSQTNVTNNQPDTSKKEIFTSAIVNNGESVIIGGLIEKRHEKVNNDVPFLSEVPLIGSLFKDENKVMGKKNLVVIVTPYIVNQDSTLSSLREELSKLYVLEEAYLNESLQHLKTKKKNKEKKLTVSSNSVQSPSLHEQRVKDIFGY